MTTSAPRPSAIPVLVDRTRLRSGSGSSSSRQQRARGFSSSSGTRELEAGPSRLPLRVGSASPPARSEVNHQTPTVRMKSEVRSEVFQRDSVDLSAKARIVEGYIKDELPPFLLIDNNDGYNDHDDDSNGHDTKHGKAYRYMQKASTGEEMEEVIDSPSDGDVEPSSFTSLPSSKPARLKSRTRLPSASASPNSVSSSRLATPNQARSTSTSPSSKGTPRLPVAAHWIPPPKEHVPENAIVPALAKKMALQASQNGGNDLGRFRSGSKPRNGHDEGEGEGSWQEADGRGLDGEADLVVEWDKEGRPVRWVRWQSRENDRERGQSDSTLGSGRQSEAPGIGLGLKPGGGAESLSGSLRKIPGSAFRPTYGKPSSDNQLIPPHLRSQRSDGSIGSSASRQRTSQDPTQEERYPTPAPMLIRTGEGPTISGAELRQMQQPSVQEQRGDAHRRFDTDAGLRGATSDSGLIPSDRQNMGTQLQQQQPQQESGSRPPHQMQGGRPGHDRRMGSGDPSRWAEDYEARRAGRADQPTSPGPSGSDKAGQSSKVHKGKGDEVPSKGCGCLVM